jgi:hypothetical protein
LEWRRREELDVEEITMVNMEEKSGLEVTCNGDPRAEIGDKVPVIVNSQQDAGPLP